MLFLFGFWGEYLCLVGVWDWGWDGMGLWILLNPDPATNHLPLEYRIPWKCETDVMTVGDGVRVLLAVSILPDLSW